MIVWLEEKGWTGEGWTGEGVDQGGGGKTVIEMVRAANVTPNNMRG